jgi:hypothetical protein
MKNYINLIFISSIVMGCSSKQLEKKDDEILQSNNYKVNYEMSLEKNMKDELFKTEEKSKRIDEILVELEYVLKLGKVCLNTKKRMDIDIDKVIQSYVKDPILNFTPEELNKEENKLRERQTRVINECKEQLSTLITALERKIIKLTQKISRN